MIFHEYFIIFLRLMDFSDRVNYVTWGQVLDLFLNKMAPTTDEKLHLRPAPLQHEPKFKAIIHTKRESIAKIIGVSSGPTYVYIIVSKYGQVGIYDEKFRLVLVMFLMVYFFHNIYLFIIVISRDFSITDYKDNTKSTLILIQIRIWMWLLLIRVG